MTAAETYPGEAMDSAMMLARIGHAEGEIVDSITRNFPTLTSAKIRDIAGESLRRVSAEQS